eukprot:TRINITY_DN17002_c0_g1_i1.p1 TRINITY_DN17002_c0_g1~~TRINITY_DN17002_c0_g1_i1.p1  ORF type:complete len:472 (-),score=99.02 TRINITY_DN17002_c0_g1_i1:179-1594(-)
MVLSSFLACVFAPHAFADSFFSSVLKAAFGNDASTELVTVPVALGLEIHGRPAAVLIMHNSTLPASASRVHDGACPDETQDLRVAVLANPRKEEFQIGELKLPCSAGAKVKLEQTLEVTKQGDLMLSLEDLTGFHPAHTLQQTFPGYRQLASLLAPLQKELRAANDTLAALRGALDVEKTESAVLFRKLAEIEKDMEARGKQLWECLREASDSERATHLTEQQLRQESEARALEAKDVIQEKEAEVSKLDSEVSRLHSELESLGKEHWSVMREATSLEEARQTLANELRLKSGQASLWLGVAATVVIGLLSFTVYNRLCPDDAAEAGSGAKRERQRLLRLLARIRRTEPSAAPSNSEEKGALPYTIVHDPNAKPPLQRVKVQCPAVQESDVSIEVIFNGAVVTIDRKASPGLEPLQCSQKFLFPAEEGHFQFSDAETRLQYGVLELVFRAVSFNKRTFRFPEHFDMAYEDM